MYLTHIPNFWRDLITQKTLRKLDDSLASETGVIDLRAVAFWCLATRERLWAEDEVCRYGLRRVNKFIARLVFRFVLKFRREKGLVWCAPCVSWELYAEASNLTQFDQALFL